MKKKTDFDESYKNGKIYAIKNITDATKIYIGSTKLTLPHRFGIHKYRCKIGKKGALFKHIENNDWSQWYIELYENYPCNNRSELEKREGKIIRQLATINKNIAGRTMREYYEENAEKIKEYQRKYNSKNAEKVKEYQNIYRKKNAEQLKEYMRKYYQNKRKRCREDQEIAENEGENIN